MATRKARTSKATPKPKKPAAKPAAKPAKAAKAVKAPKPAAKTKPAKKAPAPKAPAPPSRAAPARPAKKKPEAKVEPATQIQIEPPDPADQTLAILANVPLDEPSPLPESSEGEGGDDEPAPAEDEEEPEPEDGVEVVKFEGVLKPRQPAGTAIPLTREQSERFPGAGIVHVKGTVGGVAIQSSLMPMGDGTRSLGVHKATLEQGGFTVGDTVKVAIKLDTAPREVVVPKDFADALEKSPKARKTFANYAFTHRKEYVNWIEEAKQPETRQRRIDQAVRMIEANEKLS